MKIFKEIYNYRELLKTNIKKDIRGKYKQSFLGVFWSFLNPLLQLVVYAIIFPMILKSSIENYLIFLCVALIPWTFFANTLSQAAAAMIVNGNIIKKVYFPREIIPISVVTSATVNFLISTIIILIFVACSGIGFSMYIWYYPFILIIQYLLLLGLSFIVSSCTVFFRDLEHLIGVFLQLMFYTCPIVYAANSIPAEYQYILKYNPMAWIISAYRDIFYYKVKPQVPELVNLLMITIVLTIIGYLIFKKLQKKFAEEL